MASRRTEAFGRLVRRRRRALGLTQAELADLAGLHPSQISHIEQGWRSVRLETIFRLAWALDVEAGDLMPRFMSTPHDFSPDLTRVPPPDERPPRPRPSHPRGKETVRAFAHRERPVRRAPHLPPPPVPP